MQSVAPAFWAVVEELADLDTDVDQPVPGVHDVLDDQEILWPNREQPT